MKTKYNTSRLENINSTNIQSLYNYLTLALEARIIIT